MRIAIITENFLPKVDGVTRTLARLLEHLSLLGHTVILFGPESGMETYAGAAIIGTFGIPFLPYPELKCNFWTPRLTSKLIEFKPDIIHLVDPVFFAAIGLAVVRYYLPHTPIVSSYHTNLALYCDHFGYGFLTSIMWRWNTYCHSFSSYIACPSPSTQSILLQHGFKHDTTRIWPRGVDMALFSPHRKSYTLRAHWLGEDGNDNKTILLYVGRVSYEKNIHLLIEAYEDMNHEDCHLVLVGHGPAFDEIQTYCATRRIPVTLTGYLQGEDLSQAFASADVFAFPSTTETFGQVVLEAMASGLPVVGLESEGVKDLVKHNKTGLLLSSTEEQTVKYRGLLEKLVYQPTLLQQMSQASVKEAKRYTWFEAMDCMVQIYMDANIQQRESTYHQKVIISDDSGVEEDLDEEEHQHLIKKPSISYSTII